MNYVITGSLGHISKPLTKKLLTAGHSVSVITSKEANRAGIESLGARALVGSVEDIVFLKAAFAGAAAVYTMVPPNFGAASWKEWIGQIGKNYAEAIRINQIKYVVNLSSVGAQLQNGCGPVSGLYLAEQALNSLTDVQIRHLRPGYFFDNLLANTGMVKHLKCIGANFGGDALKLVLADSSDIADAAFEELNLLSFKGHSIRYIASDERTTAEIASVLGAAIGNPTLPWVVFSDEQSLSGMLEAGLPEEIAKNYTEMGAAINKGIMLEDYWKNRPGSLGNIKLEDFSTKFAAVYNAD